MNTVFFIHPWINLRFSNMSPEFYKPIKMASKGAHSSGIFHCVKVEEGKMPRLYYSVYFRFFPISFSPSFNPQNVRFF